MNIPNLSAIVLYFSLLPGSLLLAQDLETKLKQESSESLATAARELGDATRGAIVFFQPQMVCSKCHHVGQPDKNFLGPDLASLEPGVTDVELVESVLLPSKSIRKGFESVTVLKLDGKTLTALFVQRNADSLIVRTAEGKKETIPVEDIDEEKINTTSMMPAGQVNSLNSRQQFLDLIRYLIEIRDGGAERAAELQPSASQLTYIVPEYEKHLDHAGLIESWDQESFKRGEEIYERVCANCHGTREKMGSLPTSLRFAEGKFKNRSDPLSLYRTLTHGFGLMTPQSWMVPSQKYDVIHYIRQAYLKAHNPTQFTEVDDAYLATLPAGDTRGPEPSEIEAWSAMNYGSMLSHTIEVPGKQHNIAYKGIAVRLDPGAGGVSRGRHWMMFDTDTLRMAAAWNGTGEPNENFVDWKGIQFNGAHGIHPRVVGDIELANSTGPGWANPATGQLEDDLRVEGRDGKRYGPLPREWARYRGVYRHRDDIVFSYTIGTTEVLESPGLQTYQQEKPPLFTRTFNLGPRDRDLILKVCDAEYQQRPEFQYGVLPSETKVEWLADEGPLRLKIPAGPEPMRFTVWFPSESSTNPINFGLPNADRDLTRLTHGGPSSWQQKLQTQMAVGAEDGPFATDILTAPQTNPWLALTRFTGLDFFPDGRIAACSWDGDVWLVQVDGLKLTWQRIASGLFQPLGVKIVDGKIHLTCRDQLAILHDLNGDEEIDFYECFNHDHQVTEHFHEFAMGLQTDSDGNFYYAKSARHAKPALVPHHGTLLRVSKDGSKTDILANGFRAANGVCLNPDGSFLVTDQEGHWNPKNRINWVTLDPSGRPKFYGNMLGYHDVTDESDSAMEPPLCWITNAFDRSPAELLWVDSQKWGGLDGSLLNLSYGYGKVFSVLHETVDGVQHGGMVELPIDSFPTGVMRGRFSDADKHLYLCGMFAWAGSATHPGGLYRLRATGKAINMPTGLKAVESGLQITFTDPLDKESIDADKVQIKTWAIKRTSNYGSEHSNEKELNVQKATLSADAKTIHLSVPEIQPTWCMEIRYDFRSADGSPVDGRIHNTIHKLGPTTLPK